MKKIDYSKKYCTAKFDCNFKNNGLCNNPDNTCGCIEYKPQQKNKPENLKIMKIGDIVTYYTDNGYKAEGIIWGIFGDTYHVKTKGVMYQINISDIIKAIRQVN